MKGEATPFPLPHSHFVGGNETRYPGLVKEIHKRGHEVASHGYAHKLIHHQKPEEFREDISRSKKILEDIIGIRVLGYRAPSFSITDWAVGIIGDVGYRYDSSLMPASVSLNRRYGTLDSSHFVGGSNPIKPNSQTNSHFVGGSKRDPRREIPFFPLRRWN